MLTYSIKFLVDSISKARYKNENDIWQYVHPITDGYKLRKWRDFSDYEKISLALHFEIDDYVIIKNRMTEKWKIMNKLRTGIYNKIERKMCSVYTDADESEFYIDFLEDALKIVKELE